MKTVKLSKDQLAAFQTALVMASLYDPKPRPKKASVNCPKCNAKSFKHNAKGISYCRKCGHTEKR